MEVTEGQVGVTIWVHIDGHFIQVESVEKSAKRLGYTQRTIRRQCDEGKLIGIKLSGQWWVAVDYNHDVSAIGSPFELEMS